MVLEPVDRVEVDLLAPVAGFFAGALFACGFLAAVVFVEAFVCEPVLVAVFLVVVPEAFLDAGLLGFLVDEVFAAGLACARVEVVAFLAVVLAGCLSVEDDDGFSVGSVEAPTVAISSTIEEKISSVFEYPVSCREEEAPKEFADIELGNVVDSFMPSIFLSNCLSSSRFRRFFNRRIVFSRD